MAFNILRVKKKPRGRPFEKGHPKFPGAGRPRKTPSDIKLSEIKVPQFLTSKDINIFRKKLMELVALNNPIALKIVADQTKSFSNLVKVEKLDTIDDIYEAMKGLAIKMHNGEISQDEVDKASSFYGKMIKILDKKNTEEQIRARYILIEEMREKILQLTGKNDV